MASSYDYFISGDHQAAKDLVGSLLGQQGFTVTPTPAGGFLAKRGSAAKTFWLGAMAGKDFQLSFIVEFFSDPQGALVARLNRNIAGGALKGGAIGAAKVNTAFEEVGHQLGTAIAGTGLLVGNAAN